MSLKQVSPFLKVWHKWKTLPLPWRRQVLVGMTASYLNSIRSKMQKRNQVFRFPITDICGHSGLDLHGNTFWEFRDARGAETGRKRRIVKCPPRTHHSEVTISPAWHQWLRHTRAVAPTLEEQRADVVRQSRMKVLAAEADARWAAKPSLSDAPAPAQGTDNPAGNTSGDGERNATSPIDEKRTNNAGPTVAGEDREASWRKLQEDEKARGKKASEPNDPWKRARGGPSEGWQPKGWDPSVTSKR